MLKEMKPYYLGNVIAANDLDVIRVAVPTSYALPHCVVVEAKFGHCLAGTKLKGIAKKKNARFIVDTSGDALEHAVAEGVFLIKPNLRELFALAGLKKLDPGSIEGIGKGILAKGKCEIIVVSMGAAGAMLITNDRTESITPPVVPIKSTVGAGDSMVAGIVFYLSQGKEIIDAARYGVACGTAATMNPGTSLCKKKDADMLFRVIQADQHDLKMPA